MLSNTYERRAIDTIIVDRDSRQRRDFTTTDLKVSISRQGVINPIVIKRDGTLVAGERRLVASRELNLPDIPVRYAEDLSPVEAQIIELDENLKRLDLCWQDQMHAFVKMHKLYESLDPDWTQAKTADALGVSTTLISMTLRVARSFSDERIANAPTLTGAFNILARADDRRAGDMLSEIIETGATLFDAISGAPKGADANPPQGSADTPSPQKSGSPSILGGSPGISSGAPYTPAQPTISAPPVPSILQEDFNTWAASYAGPKFNFIHCDFPYGINAFGGAWSGKDSHQVYEDSPDVYWRLLRTLCDNLDRLMSHSAHLMFWLAGDIRIQYQTLEFFRLHAPSLDVQSYPLFWLKSDNAGIMPDPKRGPRRIYETALLASRGDRLLVKSVANAYSAPTDKAHHPSTKPQPMLQHFFSMLCDETSKFFDPTCGGGSSLRAAETLGASSVLGLELDPEHFASATSALRAFRALRKVSK